VLGGCARWYSTPALPSRNSLVLDQLVIFSDSALPQHHRLLQELRTQRTLVSTKLGLPISDEPIHVYLFPTSEKLESYLRVHYPTLPKRRAFFVESDTRLTVYAYWGDRVAEDLRHEVAHGYLHSVVPNLPLWLDEGLAEYFEVPPLERPVRKDYLDRLKWNIRLGTIPRLVQLEGKRDLTEMGEADYRYAWAWVHFMLHGPAEARDELVNFLADINASTPPGRLSERLARRLPGLDKRLVEHLKAWK
jgi:hypothetical protein